MWKCIQVTYTIVLINIFSIVLIFILENFISFKVFITYVTLRRCFKLGQLCLIWKKGHSTPAAHVFTSPSFHIIKLLRIYNISRGAVQCIFTDNCIQHSCYLFVRTSVRPCLHPTIRHSVRLVLCFGAIF